MAGQGVGVGSVPCRGSLVHNGRGVGTPPPSGRGRQYPPRPAIIRHTIVLGGGALRTEQGYCTTAHGSASRSQKRGHARSRRNRGGGAPPLRGATGRRGREEDAHAAGSLGGERHEAGRVDVAVGHAAQLRHVAADEHGLGGGGGG